MKLHKLAVLLLAIIQFGSVKLWAMERSESQLEYVPVEFFQMDPSHAPIKDTLLQALNYGDVERAIELITQGKFDPNERDNIGQIPLLAAHTRLGNIKSELSFLKPTGEDLLQRKKEIERTYELFALLLQKGANPFEKGHVATDYKNRSLYDLALKDKDQRLLDLIKKYIQPKSLTSLSLQSIVQAIKDGRMNLQKIKQQGYPEPIIQLAFDTLFKDAVEKNNITLLKNLLSQVSPNLINAQEGPSRETLLIKAVKKGNVELIKLLIAAGADPNTEDYKGKTALKHAAHNQEIFDLLLEYKKARRMGHGK